jgi:hypothetical protein
MDKDDEIADELIKRQIDLLRFSAGQRSVVLRILKTMEEDLIELLYFSGRELSEATRADKARLLKEAQKVIEASYGDISEDLARSLLGLAQVEAGGVAATLGAALQSAIVPALPAAATFKRIVDGTLIDGAPSADWWKRQAGDMAFRFKNAVGQGMAQAETNAQIISRIRGKAVSSRMVDGKRVYTYAGGVMDTSRRNAAALVQTSVQAVANQARMDTFEANDDVLKGYKQVSTLDGHTTLDCVAYSGATWDVKKQPTGKTKLPFVSPRGATSGTPRHWNCRSVIVPITKSFRELGLNIAEFEPTERAATGEPVAGSTTFDAYLKRKGKAFTDDLLGPGRAELWRSKKITLQQLLDQSGRPLSLAELKRRYGI